MSCQFCQDLGVIAHSENFRLYLLYPILESLGRVDLANINLLENDSVMFPLPCYYNSYY